MHIRIFALMTVAALMSGQFVQAQDALDISRAAGEDLLERAEIEGSDEWETKLELGATLTDGNSDTVHTTARLTTEKMHGSTLAQIVVEGAYGENRNRDDDGAKSTEKTVGNIGGSLTLKQRFNGVYAYGNLTAEHDSMAEVDYRFMLGAGLGAFVVDEEDFRFSIEAGLGYLFEEVNDISDDYAIARFAERMEYRLSETAKCWQMVEYLPKLSKFSNYMLNGEIGADAAINSDLSLGVVLKQKYDSTPGEGLKRSDTTLTAQMTIRL